MSDGESQAANGGVMSYALLSESVRRHYLGYYKLVFEDGVLDLRTKELIAVGVALMTGAPNCIEGHVRKAIELGVTRAELEEVPSTRPNAYSGPARFRPIRRCASAS